MILFIAEELDPLHSNIYTPLAKPLTGMLINSDGDGSIEAEEYTILPLRSVRETAFIISLDMDKSIDNISLTGFGDALTINEGEGISSAELDKNSTIAVPQVEGFELLTPAVGQ